MSDSPDKVGKILEEGFLLARGKLFKKAAEKLDEALKLDSQFSRQKILLELEDSLKQKDHESALTLGECIFKQGSENDVSLAIKIGNSYRHLFHPDKAKHYYELVLRKDENNELALLNLAACLNNVQKYDLEIKEMVKPFDELEGFYFPDYFDKPARWLEVLKKVGSSCRARHLIRLQQMQHLHKDMILKGQSQKAEQLGKGLEKLKRNIGKPEYSELRAYLTQKISGFDNISVDKKQRTIWGFYTYNLALCALQNGDVQQASESLSNLRQHNSKLDNQDLLLGIMKAEGNGNKVAIEHFEQVLSKAPTNRYLNVNLGILNRKERNSLESVQYFIKTSELLQASDGIYSLQKILTKADTYYKAEIWPRALKLFLIVAKEKDIVKLSANIGHCYFSLEEYDKAMEAYLDIDRFAKDSKQGKGKLKEAGELFRDKAKLHAYAANHQKAVIFYEYALKLNQSPKLLEETSKSYERIKQPERVAELKKARDLLMIKNHENRQDKHKNYLIKKGKAKMKSGKLGIAQKCLEEAFSMDECDKSIFLLYATILKKLKQPRALRIIVSRFQNANELQKRAAQQV
ncbi:MAG: hypothetical protein GY786_20295 [Proteobacteria bacterium]|nr:hypothetical protein [Pseudomonadota bacterium]